MYHTTICYTTMLIEYYMYNTREYRSMHHAVIYVEATNPTPFMGEMKAPQLSEAFGLKDYLLRVHLGYNPT